MKRPLLSVAILFMAGIVAADLLPLPPVPLLISAALLAAVCFCSARASSFLLVPMVILLGGALHSAQTTPASGCDVRLLASEKPEFVTVRGMLMGTPDRRPGNDDGTQPPRTLARVSVTEFWNDEQRVERVSGTIVTTTLGQLSAEYFAGREVEVSGILSRPPGRLASGLFDYRAYLQRQGIHFQLQVQSTNDWTRGGDPRLAPPWPERFRAWADDVLGWGFPVGDEAIELLKAMTLGWKTTLHGEIAEPFMRSGTMHVFAISGLHITLIALLLLRLLRVARFTRIWCGTLLLPALWFYAAATGWQSSAVRSTVMMSIIVAGWSLRRPPDLLNSLAAAALILLGFETQQLFQAGFQLSFSVVLALALLGPLLQTLTMRPLAPDPFLAATAGPIWKQWMHKAGRHLAVTLATSLAAWLGAIPLVAHYFHLFTPGSLLANLLVVPLSGLALMSNMGSLMTGAWLPSASVLFNHSAWLWMRLMIVASQWTAEIPGSWWQVAAPTPAGFLLYYAWLVTLLCGWLREARHRPAALTGLCVLTLFWVVTRQQNLSSTEISIVPLQGGEAIYLHPHRDQGALLIDGGNDASARAVTIPFLRAQGLNRLDALILTHGDTHHVSGTPALQTAFDPRSIFVGPAEFRSEAYRRLQQDLKRQGAIQTVARGDTIGPWRVLHPAQGDKVARADDGALVLAGTIAGVRILLLSDLDRAGQELLLTRHPDLRADLVVSGLPTSGQPVVEPFVAALGPQLLIITDSLYPARARASRGLRQRLEDQAIPVLYTRETGSLNLRVSPGGWRVSNADGRVLAAGTGNIARTLEPDRNIPGLRDDEFFHFNHDLPR